MEIFEAKKRYDEITKLLEKWSYEYYVNDNPSVSDSEYDQKYEELLRLEKEFPSLVTRNSLSQRVGGVVLKDFKKVTHERQMLSLTDVFNKDELIEWVNKVYEELGKEVDIMCELKIDGLACSLVYNDNHLFKGILRKYESTLLLTKMLSAFFRIVGDIKNSTI